MNTGERIGIIAKEKGINLHKLSTMAGIPYNTLYSIVQRKSSKIDHEILKKVSKALDVSILVLTTGKTEDDWRKQAEIELMEWEEDNRERLFGIFAARHPVFMACLRSMGIEFDIDDGELFATYEDEIVELKTGDLEKLFYEMQKTLAKSINRLWGLPVECFELLDKGECENTNGTEPPKPPTEGNTTPTQEKPSEGQTAPSDGK